MNERAETNMYQALLHDVRTVQVDNDLQCEEVADCINAEHAVGHISNEQQRYLFDVLIARN